MATSRSFNEFSKRMVIRGDGFGKNLERKIKSAALAADQVLVLSTPVDKGRARSNWVASIVAPIDQNNEPDKRGERGSDERAAANAAKAFQQNLGAIGRYRLGQGSIFLANSVPYIIPLDEGSSAQAPEGMTRQAVIAAQAAFKRGKVV